MTTALQSLLKYLSSRGSKNPSNHTLSNQKEFIDTSLFVVTIGTSNNAFIELESCLSKLGVRSFSLQKNYQNHSKLKALSHAAKIKYQEDSTPKLPRKNFYWEQIFETKRNAFNGLSGLSSMNFASEVLDFYSNTHNCKIIYLKETTEHWHRPVFENIFQLEQKGINQEQLNHLFSPQLKLIKGLTSQYHVKDDSAQENSQRIYDEHFQKVKTDLLNYPSFEFSGKEDFAMLSDFLSQKSQKKVFGM